MWVEGGRDSGLNFRAQVHFTNVYEIHYADYWLSSNERLEDRAANNKLARSKVHLMFLIWKSFIASRPEPIVIPTVFAAPQTSVYTKPRKYNELEYRIDTLELQMEFYLQILEMFCKPGNAILLIFGSGKVLCVGLVSFCKLRPLIFVF